MVQLEARPRPTALGELAGRGQADPGIHHVRPAKADVGGEQIGEREKLLPAGHRIDAGDAGAFDQGGLRDVAIGFDGERIEIGLVGPVVTKRPGTAGSGSGASTPGETMSKPSTTRRLVEAA